MIVNKYYHEAACLVIKENTKINKNFEMYIAQLKKLLNLTTHVVI